MFKRYSNNIESVVPPFQAVDQSTIKELAPVVEKRDEAAGRGGLGPDQDSADQDDHAGNDVFGRSARVDFAAEQSHPPI